MAQLNIKSEETYRLATELAALTGESLTTAVTEALRERLEREMHARDRAARRGRLAALAAEIRASMRAGASSDHAWLYRRRPRAVIVDTSALLAVLLAEPDGPRFLDAIVAAEHPRMSAASWLEAALVVEEKGGRLAALRFDEFMRTAGITLCPVTVEQAQAARQAWRYFGRNRHSGKLDLGDCFAYALAKTSGEKLLFKGEDFARTDIDPALPAAPTKD